MFHKYFLVFIFSVPGECKSSLASVEFDSFANLASVKISTSVILYTFFYSALIVAHFWAPWAPQCKQITDALNELAKDAKCSAVKFCQVRIVLFAQ